MVEFIYKSIWSWTFVCWEFVLFFVFVYFADSVSWLVIILFISSVFFWFSFRRLYFLGIYPFILGCPFYWCLIVVIFYDPLYCCGVVYNFSFISDFIDLVPLFFLLMSLAKGLSILFIFSKNQLLVSLIFSAVVLSLHLFLLRTLFFFPSTNFEFCLFFYF